MTTAINSFDTFLENVRLPKELRDACRDEHKQLQAKLLADRDLAPIFVSMFLQGSYARHTGTKPNGSDGHVDVDLVVVTNLNPIRYKPDAVVELFRPFLDREYPNEPGEPKQWERQDRAIKIMPRDRPVTLDLVVTAAPSEIQEKFFRSFRETGVPELQIEARGDRDSQQVTFREAVERINKAIGGADWQKEPLLIPSRDLQIWVPTHPIEQINWTTRKNDATNGHYVNVVKAIRWWRKENPAGEYPKSYPLEHFVGDTTPDGIDSVAEGVVRVLERIANTQQPWQFGRGVPVLPDRGVPANDVFRKVTPEQYLTFHGLVTKAAPAARAALDAVTNAESVARWNELLGSEFPTPPSTPFTPPTGPAKATTSGRFG